MKQLTQQEKMLIEFNMYVKLTEGENFVRCDTCFIKFFNEQTLQKHKLKCKKRTRENKLTRKRELMRKYRDIKNNNNQNNNNKQG